MYTLRSTLTGAAYIFYGGLRYWNWAPFLCDWNWQCHANNRRAYICCSKTRFCVRSEGTGFYWILLRSIRDESNEHNQRKHRARSVFYARAWGACIQVFFTALSYVIWLRVLFTSCETEWIPQRDIKHTHTSHMRVPTSSHTDTQFFGILFGTTHHVNIRARARCRLTSARAD